MESERLAADERFRIIPNTRNNNLYVSNYRRVYDKQQDMIIKTKDYERAVMVWKKKDIKSERQIQDAVNNYYKNSSDKYLCTECEKVIRPVRIKPIHDFVELGIWILWLISCYTITGILFIFIPMIVSLYNVTKIKKECPECKTDSVIPADSAKAKRLINLYKTR